ncbi:NUDIX hydrolase [Sulfurovum sp. zt1-1]|uniref:NUDIX hydrolase n=1 Tax=Sulfurovum zhangzhouensis TaxID=3019067 RepID=A0ABT7QYL6_9BACT|nr:NUDIX hydrolase [Sulfurovum zhangzhouensis]MDM5271931.1 NUDIX hydrolase [Sulfurovum zhangzhouensis]
MSFTPKTPYLSIDGIIEVYEDGIFQGIVLIERKHEPYGLALPGGFVDIGETVEQALVREMKEETGLDVEIDRILGIYSEAERDPRFHTATVVYVAKASGEPKGGDDAKVASLYALIDLPLDKLVFDHGKIVADYLKTVH